MSEAQGSSGTLVADHQTAVSVGSGSVEVFSTPSMVALMEAACCDCVYNMGVLPEGKTTVGTSVNIKHISPTPVGVDVNAVAVCTENKDNKSFTFQVTATDSAGEIGSGTMTRVAVNIERFMASAQAKKETSAPPE